MVFLRCIDTACATVPVPFESSADLERVVTVISALVPNLAAVAGDMLSRSGMLNTAFERPYQSCLIRSE